MHRSGWKRVGVFAVVVALASMVSNISTSAQMSGAADPSRAVRLVFSQLLNSGTVWAGLPIVAGWLVAPLGGPRGLARWGEAALAGLVSAELALVVHYASGQLAGIYGWGIWSSNAHWFATGPLCAVLGLVGSAARRADLLGLLGRCTIPLGALAEPFLLHMFSVPSILPWPNRVSTAVCGGVLVAAGVVGMGMALWSWHRDQMVEGLPGMPGLPA